MPVGHADHSSRIMSLIKRAHVMFFLHHPPVFVRTCRDDSKHGGQTFPELLPGIRAMHLPGRSAR